MARTASTRWRPVVFWCTLAYLTALGALLVSSPNHGLVAALGIGNRILAYCGGGACCLTYGLLGKRTDTVRRAGWLLLGAGLVAFALGDCAWAHQSGAKWASTAPGAVTDILYLSGYASLISGMWLLPRFARRTDAAKLALDCTMVAAGLAIAGWHFVMRVHWFASGATTFDRCFGVVQPLGDIVLFACAIAFCTSSDVKAGVRVSARLLAFAMGIATAADCAYAVSLVRGAYETGPWVDLGWIVPAVLFGAAALWSWWAQDESSPARERPRRGEGRAVQWPPFVLTYVPIVLALLVFGTHERASNGPDSVEVTLAVLLVAAAMFRRFILEAEKSELTGRLTDALVSAQSYSDALAAAEFDPLTGLPNHKATNQAIERGLVAAAEGGTLLSIIVMDVDDFRLFNNAHGYATGDRLLQRVAAVLRERPTPGEDWGRYGGDEFLAILPLADEEAALAAATRLRARFANELFRWGDDCIPVPLRLSFGVATYPTDGTNRLELLDAADENLHLAKRAEVGVQASTVDKRVSQELLADGGFSVLDAMVAAVDNKDTYTRRHSEDVAKYASWIAEELGWSEEARRAVRLGALLHDVGKIGVPSEILRKPAGLTANEYEIVKRHPEFGATFAAAIPGTEPILDAVRYHHERWDGKGYPDGLAGEDTPALGRLIAVADAVSAMTMDRPYRKGLTWEDALEQTRVGGGSQFDPRMVEAFLAAAARRTHLQKAA